LTLAAMVIVIGIIVDDAIVIVENIFRHYEEGKEPLQAAIDGTVEVGLPVFTTVATTILAFLPMFFIKGILGKFIYVVPLTVVLSLIVSMLEAFFILPAHILKGLKKNKQKDAGKNWFVPFRNAFEFLLKDVLKFRYASLFIAMFLLVVSLGYAKNFIKFKLFDRSRVVDSIDISLEMPIGTSLMATSAKGLEFEAILKKFPKTEISSYYMKVGRGGTRGSTGTHLATLTLYPASDKILSRSINEITYDLNTKFTKVKGVKKLTIGTTTRGPKMGRPLEVMIKGSQGGSRNRVIIEVMEFLNNINGISGMDIDTKAGKEEIVIIPNYTLLARYGLKVSDLAQTVRLAYDGEIATVNRYGDEDVDFRVIMQKTFRENIEQLKLLKVPDSKGNLIDLGEIADFSIRPGVYAIYHENGESAVTISADINQKMVTSIEVIKKIKAHFDYEYMKKYSGIRIDIGGEAKNTRQMLIDMGISFLMAVIGIYALLMLQFNSLAQPLIVMLAIPFGLTGVILAYGLQGFMTMSMFAGIGVIGLIGVVVNDSLVMVDHLNSIKKSSGLDDSVSFIAKGAANRLRPVLVTTVTTVAGLLPLAYGIGGKDPMMADMAMSMGWGLLFATPVTLLILPCLYMIGEDLGNIFNRKSEEK
ncbi:efflux RND transporter permease subunit, partial [bacterium]|nr:efflux RND transporter permease subunit [bacterium]